MLIQLLQYLSLLMILTYPFLHRWLNRERGAGWSKMPKLLVFGVWGLTFLMGLAAFILPNPLLSQYPLWLVLSGSWLILTLGYVYHYAPGWGKYFPTKNHNTSHETEIKYIDWLTEKWTGIHYNPETPDEDGVHYKTVAFSLRMAVLAIPLYGVAALLTHSLVPILAVPPMLFAGVIYRLSYEQTPATEDAGATAEREFGELVGLTQSVVVAILLLLANI